MVKQSGGIPFHAKNYKAQGSELLNRLARVWEHLKRDPKDFHALVERMCGDPYATAEVFLEEVNELECKKLNSHGKPFRSGEKQTALQLAIINVACAYAACALRTIDEDIGRKAVVDGTYWLGIAQGFIAAFEVGKGELGLAKIAADARHVENRQMKADVFQWCERNLQDYRSMDAAAEAIAGNVVPVTFRTVRGWIGEWKKQQSAGKP